MLDALRLYRHIFKPSKQLDQPYVMLGINVIAAATDGEAQRHFTSLQQSFTNLRRGMPGQIPPPIDDIDTFWSPAEKALASQTLTVSAVGSPETVTRGLQPFLDVTHPDELIITAHIYDHKARLRSFELVADLRANLTSSPTNAEAKVTA
jgi:alkanesulfonate monooxygenase SsuD/methylene tetrahydromethanopterin reductase-like flavin-dependent oxidoreductase (luciferase family)